MQNFNNQLSHSVKLLLKSIYILQITFIAIFVFNGCVDKTDIENPIQCQRECPYGIFQCQGYLVQECIRDESNCLVWETRHQCEAPYQTCSLGKCLTIDPDYLCVLGDKKCTESGNGWISCNDYDNDGDFEWGLQVNKCDDNKVCDDKSGDDLCVIKCPDEANCRTGERRCDPLYEDNYQECKLNANGCKEWGHTTPCGENNVCKVEGACVREECEPECYVKGAPNCYGPNSYRICEEDDNDCLVHSEVKMCDFDQLCNQQTNRCEPICHPECAQEGISICDNNGYKVCQNVNNCLKYTVIQACPPNQICNPSSANINKCEDSCTENLCNSRGQYQCNGDFEEVCDYHGKSCLSWKGTKCSSNQFCNRNTGHCEESCSGNLCDFEGETRCMGNKAERCERRGSCLSWQQSEICTSEQLCTYDYYGNAYCGCKHECDVTEKYCMNENSITVCEPDINTGCYKKVVKPCNSKCENNYCWYNSSSSSDTDDYCFCIDDDEFFCSINNNESYDSCSNLMGYGSECIEMDGEAYCE